MTGPLRGLWRYRAGDYRIICDIVDERLVVLVIKVEHRGSVYR
ncbi:type II toxin-antitoxin system RelE family toxin [Rhizobium sp.]